MRGFQYEGVNRQGRPVSGSIQALDQHQAIGFLNQQGLTVTRIVADADTGGSPFAEWAPLSFPLPVLSVFSRQFAALLKSGFDPVSGLKVMQDQTSNPLLRSVIMRMNQELSTDPKPIAEIMRKYRKVFPPLYVNLVSAAETGGFLDRVLSDISDFYDREIEWRRRLQGQLIYPKVTFVFYLIVTFFLSMILPAYLPSGFTLMSPSFFFIGLAVVAVYFLYIFAGRTRSGHAVFHGFALHLPLIGKLYRSISLARFFNISSLQVEAGVPLHDTLTTAARASGDYRVVGATNRILSSLDSGATLNEAFKSSGFFSRSDVGMVAVGEAAGDTSQMMAHVSKYYAMESETNAAHLSAFLRTAIPMIIYILAGFAIVSFYASYFSSMWGAAGGG